MTSQKEPVRVVRVRPSANQKQRLATFKVTQLIWIVLGILESLIGLRVFLKMIAANPENPFAKLLYGFTDIFVMPFQSLVGAPSAEGMVLEISSLIAMIVYLLIFWGMIRLISVIFYQPR
jgi:uncharacterized protein YggT (Ycf19 family)